MPQDEISKRVFSFIDFSKSNPNADEYTEIRDTMDGCQAMAEISPEFRPKFFYF